MPSTSSTPPILRVTGADVPMPYNKHLEKAAKVDAAKVVAAVAAGAVPRRSRMATKVVMEALSPTMEEGRLVEWKKQEGESVAAGDVLAEVETDKAVMELVARVGGVLLRQMVQGRPDRPGVEPVAVIGEPGESIENGKRRRRGAGKRAGSPAAVGRPPCRRRSHRRRPDGSRGRRCAGAPGTSPAPAPTTKRQSTGTRAVRRAAG